MFGNKTPPIPATLPQVCDNCGKKLHWEAMAYTDPVIGIVKVDHYRAHCACGEVYYRDQRGQVVEPASENQPPDRFEFANSPQGPQPYSGFMEFVQQERAKEEALKKAQAAKAAAAAAAPAEGAAPAAGAPAEGAAPAAAAPAPAAAPATEANPA